VHLRLALRDKLVDVMGSDIHPYLLITRIDEDFGVSEAEARREKLASLIQSVFGYSNYNSARELMLFLDFSVNEISHGLFREPDICVTTPDKEILRFAARPLFVRWVRENLCKQTEHRL